MSALISFDNRGATFIASLVGAKTVNPLAKILPVRKYYSQKPSYIVHMTLKNSVWLGLEFICVEISQLFDP